MPRIPSDQCSPYGTAAAAKRSKASPAETASPPRRQGDRGSGDDDGATDGAVERATKLAARRSGLMQAGLPVFYRFNDLVAAGIVQNRTMLLRLIDNENFPPGVMIGRNTRAWRVTDIETWIASRPTARKVTPPGARNPRTKRRAEAQP
jgi:hypothetical protein